MRGPRKIPDWAPKNERKWPAGCSPYKWGWTRWYRGNGRHVCGKTVPLDQIESCWNAVKAHWDAVLDAKPEPGPLPNERTYRDTLSEFMAIKRASIDAARKSITRRTFQNYEQALNDFGNFVSRDGKIADLPIAKIGPEHFTAYAGKFSAWKSSGWDSVVSRVGALFRWAVEMDYIERYRPGPQFRRPDKKEIRSERIELQKVWTLQQIAKAWASANLTMRCFIALGICAGFNNSDIAHFNRTVYDAAMGIIDFRRRKSGKIRRVIPLPPDVMALLASYSRPEPSQPRWSDLFFISVEGNPYAGGDEKPSNSISALTRKLLDSCGIKGKSFSGLRTTHFNLAPKGKWETERSIVMGHAKGTIALDHYLEEVGVDELRHYVAHVWGPVKAEIEKSIVCPSVESPNPKLP